MYSAFSERSPSAAASATPCTTRERSSLKRPSSAASLRWPSGVMYCLSSMARSVANALMLAALACGSRTGLTLDRPDAMVDGPTPCLRDFECDDGVECTIDRCAGGECARLADDRRCDDGLYCSGDERCDLTLDCVTTPRACDDGVSCTHDACDESVDMCVADPDVALCPISHRCDPTRDCVARTLVHTPEALYEIDLPGGESHF